MTALETNNVLSASFTQTVAVKENCNPNQDDEDILTLLCTFAPSNEVRIVIRLYEPKKTVLQLNSSLNRHTKPQIIAALEYLGIKHDWKEHHKPECLKMLLSRINNLVPRPCSHSNDM